MTTTILSRFFVTLSAAAFTSVLHFSTNGFRGKSINSLDALPVQGAVRVTTTTTTKSSLNVVDSDPVTRGLITNLPGLDYDPGFRQYSGYLTVSPENGRNIFYWYMESQNDPAKDPVVLWTNGGPGCSGLIGMFREHGPYLIESDLKLAPNPYSWNKMANMLYIEQPAGVGFSYSDNSRDYHTGDRQTTLDNYQLIRTFLERYPERQTNDFYIASESYGGHYMPQLALEILRSNTDGLIHFKGVLVGNPFVDPFSNSQAEIGSYYSHGLLPGPLYQRWVQSCGTQDTFNTQDCEDLAEVVFAKAGVGINPYALDYPVCLATIAAKTSSLSAGTRDSSHRRVLSSTKSQSSKRSLPSDTDRSLMSSQETQLKRSYQKRRKHDHHITNPPFVPSVDRYRRCSELHTIEYLNQQHVQRALHVREDKSSAIWSTCSEDIKFSQSDIATNVIPLYRDLLNLAVTNQHKLNIMIFSGDDDSVCATAGTQTWLWDLGVDAISLDETWKPWVVNYQTAGYVTKFDVGNGGANFTFATVHGAGHEVPAYRPMEALELFQRYLTQTW